ncbi:MAG TPA: hypothetical protein VK921_09280, partial [Anditalea sp.]|nr:hypothetical protein [Anditalea sp.]
MIKKSHLWAVYNGTLTPSLLIEGSKGTFKIMAANNSFCQLSELDEDSISGLKPTEVIRIFSNTTTNKLLHELEDS